MTSRSSHTERTAAQPRQSSLHPATLSSIRLINPRIRLLKLVLPYAINFLPGQWLDVHIPTLPKAGGFTITSTPGQASSTHKDQPTHQPYLELAIQKSPANPPAAWLWRPEYEILGSELKVRVGGNFVWPPPNIDVGRVKRLVLIAGGVGINPLISVLTHLRETHSLPETVRFLYATKMDYGQKPEEVLFWPRLVRCFPGDGLSTERMELFVTGEGAAWLRPGARSRDLGVRCRRMEREDLMDALGPVESRHGAVAYVCGPAGMTDEIVGVLKEAEGMSGYRVLCEKWW